jgi:hypothetical protein
MRPARLMWLGLLAALLTGCLPDHSVRSSSLLSRFRQLGGPTGPEAVYIEYVLVERPFGDVRINREAWGSADEQVLGAETRAVVEENGFRIGLVGGLIPTEIDALVKNPKSTMGHRQRRLYAGNAAAITLNGPLAQCRFVPHAPGEKSAEPVTLEQAQCVLNITPSLADGGKVRVQFAPEMQYHDKKHFQSPAVPAGGWLNAAQKPADRYPEFAWDVTVSPSEWLLVGTFYDRDESLGYQFFNEQPAGKRVQRLLLIRAGRVQGADPLEGVDLEQAPGTSTVKDGTPAQQTSRTSSK